jgi:hypothetical protein
MSPERQAAVENAYREFAYYRLKGTVYVCNCPVCVDAQSERDLCTVPLRQISARLLTEYTHSGHGWDDRIADEFRYFLPRYFELIAAGDPPSNIGIETCLGQLYVSSYRSRWPKSEVAAIDAFFVALVRAQLAAPVHVDRTGIPRLEDDALEDTLCMIANADGDLAQVLAAWDADRSRAATLRIAHIISVAKWRKKVLANSFWDGLRPRVEAGMRQVVAWLLQPETRERLEAACLAEADADAAALLSHAEGLVAGMMGAGRSTSPI